MQKIIFATGNETKSKRFSKGLLAKSIEVLSLKDINIKIDINENGKTAVENALIKARKCYKEIKMATMGMDDSLYLEGVPKNLQPGLYVRRVNGKTLNDEEMIEYYTNLVKEYGVDGKLNCKWVYGLAVINDRGVESTYTWSKDNFYLVDKESDIINSGYPLNSISKYKKINKYFTDVSQEELKLININEDHVIDFIENSTK